MLTFKVGAKGGVSVYGLGRFPVTLYASQWDSLLAAAPEIAAFVDANRGQLRQRSVSAVREWRGGSPGYDHAAGYQD